MTTRYYRDFVLYADSPEFEGENAGGRPSKYMLRVFDSPEGEGEEPEPVAVDDWDQLDEWRRSLSDRSISNDELTKFGLRMGQMILPPAVRDLYFRSLATLAASEDGLRVRLRLFPALDVLPWEYTRVTPREGGLDVSEFVFLNPKISIVRHQPVATPAQPFRTGMKHRLVVAMASPRLYVPLKLAEEQRVMQDLLQRGSGIEAVYYPNYREQPHSKGATEDEIAAALTVPTDIFHFSGHGNFEQCQGREFHTVEGIGQIILAERDGLPHVLTGDALGHLLQAGGVRLAILGACETAERDVFNAWSSVASSLLKRAIPAVIAMQFRIHDDMARHFASVLYDGLVMGDVVDSALSRARLAMWRRNPADRDWGAPVLYMRISGGCILGAVLDAEVRRAAEQASARTTAVNAAFQHWRERQALANREQLEYLEASGDSLDATETDLLILTRSALACDADTEPWVSRFSTVGEALVRRLELGEKPPTPPVAGDVSELLGVDAQPAVDDVGFAERGAALDAPDAPVPLEPPVTPVAPGSISRSAVLHADSLTRRTACLALLALGPQAALERVDSTLRAGITDEAGRRRRRAELYGVLAENDPETAQEVSRRIHSIPDRFAVWRWRAGRYWRRDRGRIGRLSLRGALAAGLALGCYRAILAIPRQEIVLEQFLTWFVPGFLVSLGLLLGMFLSGPLFRYDTRHPAPDKARRVAAWGVITGAVGFALVDMLLKGMEFDFGIGTAGGAELWPLTLWPLTVSLLVGAGLGIGLWGLAYGGLPGAAVHRLVRLLAVACVCMLAQLPVLCEFRLTTSTEWNASKVFIPTQRVRTGYEKYEFMRRQFSRCSPQYAASRSCCAESCVTDSGDGFLASWVAGCVEEWLSILDAGIVGVLLAASIAFGVRSSGKAFRWLGET